MARLSPIAFGSVPKCVRNYRDMIARTRSGPYPDATTEHQPARSSTPRKSTPRQPSYAHADGREMQRPGLLGVAALFGETFIYEGAPTRFARGAFRLSDNVRLLFDHDAGLEVGSTTASGLEISATDDALLFRMPLSGSEIHHRAAGLVATDERSCVSVGGTIEASRKEWQDGQRVTIVERFDLREISLCAQGRVPNTWAAQVDLADYGFTLSATARSSSFESLAATQRILASGRRIGWLVAGEMVPERPRWDTQAIPASAFIREDRKRTADLQQHALRSMRDRG